MKSLLLLLTITLHSASIASQSIGYYTSGSLKNAVNIQDYQGLYHKVFTQRKRYYTSESMARLLDYTSFIMHARHADMEPFQIGDLSNKHGGKAYGHKSHQNGLDADIVYLHTLPMLQLPRSSKWATDFVNGRKVTSSFHVERNFELFKRLVDSGQVSRIFVDWAVKRHYCQNKEVFYKDYDKEIVDEVLRRLRPAKHHETHLHVRLKCPKNNYKCRPQSEPSVGTACAAAIRGPSKTPSKPRWNHSRRRDKR